MTKPICFSLMLLPAVALFSVGCGAPAQRIEPERGDESASSNPSSSEGGETMIEATTTHSESADDFESEGSPSHVSQSQVPSEIGDPTIDSSSQHMIQSDVGRLWSELELSDGQLQALHSEDPSGHCGDALVLVENICDLAERICAIETGRCDDARARCERARARLDYICE